MKRYIKNLWLALMGTNPFQQELDEKSSQYEKASKNISTLKEQYITALDKWDQTEKSVRGLQQLVENLRERLREKDLLMEKMKQEYQDRIKSYNLLIDEIRTGNNTENTKL